MRANIRRAVFCVAAVWMTWASGTGDALGAEGSWTNNLSGNWSGSSNWAGTIPDAAGDVAWFTNNISVACTVTVNTTNRTLGILTIGDANATHGFSIAPSGGAKLTFDNTPNSANAQLNQVSTSTNNAISVTNVLNSSLDINNASPYLLAISGGITNEGGDVKTLSNVGSGSGGVTISGIIGTSVSVVQDSVTSPLTLSGASTYTGETVAASGTLRVGAANAIPGGAGRGNVLVNGTLDVNFADTINGLSGTGKVNNSSGTAAILTVGGNNQTSAFSGMITNTGATTSLALTKAGTGTLTLSGNNGYGGLTTVSAGVLTIQSDLALGLTNNGTVIASNAALQVQGGITTPAEALTLNGSGIANNGALRSLSGINTFAGLVTLGATGVRINSDSGTLTLSHPGTITGSGFALTLGGAGSTTINSAIGTGTGTLTKDGGGTVTLTGASTYTGVTTVSNGTLLVDGSLGAGGGAVTVMANSVLGGTGVISRAVTIAAGAGGAIGGTLAPGGTNVGTLTINGNFSFIPTNAAAQQPVWSVQLGATANDLLVVNGSFIMASTGKVTLKIGNAGALPNNKTYTLMTWTNANPVGDAAQFEVVCLDPNWTNATVTMDTTAKKVMLGGLVDRIANVVATKVTTSTADLIGNLTSTGSSPTTVWVFWDTTDRTTNRTWLHSTNFVATRVGPITNSIASLSPNQTNYFTYYASNTEGEVWAQPSLSFKTWGPLSVDNGDGATGIGYTYATLRGTLLDGNGAYASIRWGTHADLALATTSTPAWVTEGVFPVLVTGLVNNTTYYYQALVSNSYDRATAASITNFTTPPFVGKWYVATDGPTNGDGSTWGMALTNIQTAINGAANGDTICVKTGVYSRTSQIVLSNKTLSIIGGYTGTAPEPGPLVNDPAATRIDAQQNSRVMYITSANNVVLSNLTFSGGKASPGLGLNINNSSVRAVDCAIQDNKITSAGVQGAGLYVNGGTSVFERCSFLRNTILDNDWQINYGGAVYHNAGNLELRSCVLAGNRVDTQGNNNAGHGGAVYAASAGSLRLYNCLIRDNFVGGAQSSYAEAITCADAIGTVSIENCTVAANFPRGIRRRGAGTVSITHSIVWNNGDDDLVGAIDLSYSSVGDTNAGTGMQYSDPQFVQGYYLADGSPCVNAGGDTAENIGVAGLYAQTNTSDVGQVDLGYHHPAALSVSTIHVSPSGSDTTGTGAAGTPYRSVTKALAVAPEHARISIAAGSYTTNCETFPLSLTTDGVQLLGSDAVSTEINASGAGVKRVMTVNGVSRWAMLSNVTIRGGNLTAPGDGGAGLKLIGTGVRLCDCTIWTNKMIVNNVSPWQGFGSAVFLEDAAPWFERCEFRNNIGGGQILGGIYQRGGRSRFSACRFVGNTQSGSAEGGAALFNDYDYGQMRLFNCLIVSNGTVANMAGGIHAAAGALVSLDNCTLANNGPRGLYGASGASVYVTNSILWSNVVDAIGDVTLAYCDVGVVSGAGVIKYNCLSTNPLFVSSGDYRLQTAFKRWSVATSNWVNEARTSPAVDAGISQDWMATATDLDGLPRRLPDMVVDMGAYEANPQVAIANVIATNVTDTTADLIGNLTATGSSPTTVWVFWATNDFTTNKAWTHSESFVGGQGRFTNSIGGLNPNQINYFTYYASNTEGEVWAQPSLSFKTWGPLSVDNGGGATSIGYTIATLWGTLLDGNGAYASIRWGTNGDLTLATTSTPTWVTEGVFSVPVTGLVNGTTYYYQSLVSNAYDTAAASITTFTTPLYTGLYVATNGPAGGDGSSWGMALTTLASAFAVAKTGETIYVAGHTFVLTNQLVWPKSHLALLGGYAATNTSVGPGEYDSLKWPTVITRNPANSTRLISILNTTNALIERVTFRGGNAGAAIGSTYTGAGLYATNSYGLIRNVVFENNAPPLATGYATGGGAYLAGGGLTFEHVVFANNSLSSPNSTWFANGAGVYIASGTHRFRNILGVGGRLPYSSSLGSFLYVNAGAVTVENATVAHNSGVGQAALYRGGGSLQVANSILWDNDGGDFAGTITFSNCCSTGLTGGVQGNLNQDPLFQTPHFLLATGSPCIARGNRTVEAAGVTNRTSFANGVLEPAGTAVNLGYHFPEGLNIDLELWVNPAAGSDANSGSTAGSPLRTLTRALALAAPRTRINLAAGSYTNGVETFPLTIDGKTVQWIGTDRDTTVINSLGSGQPALVLRNSLGDNRIEGITLTTGSSNRGLSVSNAVFTLFGCSIAGNQAVEGSGLHAIGSHGLIQDTVFRNNAGPVGLYNGNGGGAYLAGGGLQFERVLFVSNRANGGNSGWSACGGGVYIDSGTHRFRNILMASNSVGFFAAGCALRGSGVYIINGAVVIENATLVNHSGASAIYRGGGAVSVHDSILWSNPTGDYTGTIAFSYCCSTGLAAGVQGNLTNDPLFVDRTYYHLQSRVGNYVGGYFSGGSWGKSLSNSPCIDAGDPVSDRSREPNPNGNRVNLGAYGNTPQASLSISVGTLLIIL